MVGPRRPEFVLFGSSIVELSFCNEGWGSILAHTYARKADIIVRGYSGWNSRLALQVLDRVFPKDAVTQPSLVIVYFGGNDSMGPHPSRLTAHVPLPEYIDNMRKIATHLKLKGDALVQKSPRLVHLDASEPRTPRGRQFQKGLSDATRIIFLSAPPVNESQIREWSRNFLFGLRTNERCRIYSEALVELCEDMDIKVIDLWTSIRKKPDWLTTCFTDGIHLTEEGSKIVAKEVLKVIKEQDWKPSLYWESMPKEFSNL